MSMWEQIALNEAIVINLLVAFFYPFSDVPIGEHINLIARLNYLAKFIGIKFLLVKICDV